MGCDGMYYEKCKKYEIILMRAAGYTQPQIARELNIGIATVQRYLYRPDARVALVQHIEQLDRAAVLAASDHMRKLLETTIMVEQPTAPKRPYKRKSLQPK